jgi:hypothetical protein
VHEQEVVEWVHSDDLYDRREQSGGRSKYRGNLIRNEEMKWNHRVVDMTAENGGEPLFALREVFYNDDGVPTSHGEPNAVSENMEGLEWCIGEMRDALKHPVLKPEDFEPKSWAKLIQEPEGLNAQEQTE